MRSFGGTLPRWGPRIRRGGVARCKPGVACRGRDLFSDAEAGGDRGGGRVEPRRRPARRGTAGDQPDVRAARFPTSRATESPEGSGSGGPLDEFGDLSDRGPEETLPSRCRSSRWSVRRSSRRSSAGTSTSHVWRCCYERGQLESVAVERDRRGGQRRASTGSCRSSTWLACWSAPGGRSSTPIARPPSWLRGHRAMRIGGRAGCVRPATERQRELAAAIQAAAIGEPRRAQALVLRDDDDGIAPLVVTCLPLPGEEAGALVILGGRSRGDEPCRAAARGLRADRRRTAAGLSASRRAEPRGSRRGDGHPHLDRARLPEGRVRKGRGAPAGRARRVHRRDGPADVARSHSGRGAGRRRWAERLVRPIRAGRKRRGRPQRGRPFCVSSMPFRTSASDSCRSRSDDRGTREARSPRSTPPGRSCRCSERSRRRSSRTSPRRSWAADR